MSLTPIGISHPTLPVEVTSHVIAKSFGSGRGSVALNAANVTVFGSDAGVRCNFRWVLTYPVRHALNVLVSSCSPASTYSSCGAIHQPGAATLMTHRESSGSVIFAGDSESCRSCDVPEPVAESKRKIPPVTRAPSADMTFS